MKKFLCCIWIIPILGISRASLSIPAADDKDAAITAAQSWLALVDSGKYAQSWDEAAQVLKSQITKRQWIDRLNSIRLPLGKMESRILKSSVFYTKSLPGIPESEYVILQYETNLERSRSFIEMITPTKEKDGQWRVSGYLFEK